MGQYFEFINFDKKEILSPYTYGSLAKVMEHSYQGNHFMCALEKLMKTSWKNDRILYVGDYVNEFYNNPAHKKTFQKLIKETNTQNLYDVDYKEKKVNLSKEHYLPTRYLYNHDTKEYVDLKKQPIQWGGFDRKDRLIFGTKIHPLSILLCASNGAGGSYYGKNMDLVGSWVNSLGKIEISDKLLNVDYQEINVVFDETNTNKSNIEILKDIIDENVKSKVIEDVSEVKFYDDLFLDANEKEELISYAKTSIRNENQRLNNKNETIKNKKSKERER